ncbi:hypothetical protein I7I53_10216 [Histoplasma capsulatum var. duboisii H88]|uniref:Uncharacterized protein n=1 Tax=Ajellomyces capsulatus (strain H88) TaxID=544711 RepID=A0A8A1LAS1_AJEC8|nr:hypothetical protein I7I53_10216 [Histoplasma capsulatum var. duboisii H88]
MHEYVVSLHLGVTCINFDLRIGRSRFLHILGCKSNSRAFEIPGKFPRTPNGQDVFTDSHWMGHPYSFGMNWNDQL